MALNCGDTRWSCCGDRFDGCARCPAVAALGGGDVGVAGQSADVDRGVPQGGHDLRPGAGADGRVVLTESDIADPCAVRRCCFEWRWKTFVAVPVAAGRCGLCQGSWTGPRVDHAAAVAAVR